MPLPEKYRVAVIGRTGKGNYGHGLNTVWVNHPRAEIVAVADENEKGREAAVKRLGAKVGYADFNEMLDKEKPQIGSVCERWPDCHRDMMIACAERGINVFLEKPVARNLQEADAMVAATEKHHVKVAVAHQTRSTGKLCGRDDKVADDITVAVQSTATKVTSRLEPWFTSATPRDRYCTSGPTV